MESSELLSVSQVKAAIKEKRPFVGLQFVNDRGARGTVIDGLSAHGKRQAEMTCTIEGCSERHVREQSDWHQSYLCRTHSKSKSKSNGVSTGTGGAMKAEDGTVYRLQKVLETDDAETVAKKEEINAVFMVLKEKRATEAKAAKEKKAADKRAKIEADRAVQTQRRASEKKAMLAANLQRIREYAKKMNLPVSDVTLRQAEEADLDGVPLTA